MDMSSKDNANPLIHQSVTPRQRLENEDNGVHDKIDAREVFDHIRDINDPEHPLTLEDLRVVNEKDITVNDHANTVTVAFTPTIPHCSMATLIGLAIRVQLLRVLPPRFKVDIKIAEGTHQSEEAVNKQLADKERVAAALENHNLISVVNQCLTMKARQ